MAHPMEADRKLDRLIEIGERAAKRRIEAERGSEADVSDPARTQANLSATAGQ